MTKSFVTWFICLCHPYVCNPWFFWVLCKVFHPGQRAQMAKYFHCNFVTRQAAVLGVWHSLNISTSKYPTYVFGIGAIFFFVSQGEAETSHRGMRVIHFVVDKHINEVTIEDRIAYVESIFQTFSERRNLVLACMLTCWLNFINHSKTGTSRYYESPF